MKTGPVHFPVRNRQQRRRLERALLVAWMALALLMGMQLSQPEGAAWDNLLFQSPPTDTSDPNSPLPTPIETPVPSDTPLSTDTPLPVDTPPFPEATLTSLPLPTATLPPLPTATSPPLPTPLPPVQSMPTATFAEVVLPELATPAQPTQTVTGVLPGPVIIVPVNPQPDSPAEEGADERRLDPALLIDNLVIAFGYLWVGCGILLTLAGAVVGVILLRRSSKPRGGANGGPSKQPGSALPAATPGPQPATPRPATPSRSTTPSIEQATGTPPSPGRRAAARHRPQDVDSIDGPEQGGR